MGSEMCIRDSNTIHGGKSPFFRLRIHKTNISSHHRPVTVSADDRPGGRLNSGNAHPVRVIKDGIHCSDLLTQNGQVNAGVAEVQKAEIAKMVQWVKQFGKKGSQITADY